MLTVSLQGRLLDRALLREPGSLAVAAAICWRTRAAGCGVSPTMAHGRSTFADAPPGGRDSAVAEDEQQLFLFDGAALHAYDQRAQRSSGRRALPGVGGDVSLSLYDRVVLLTSNHGDIIAVQASSGGVCNATRIYGSNRSHEWHSLGDDGILRVYVADQIIGLNWNRFLHGVRVTYSLRFRLRKRSIRNRYKIMPMLLIAVIAAPTENHSGR